MTLVATNRYERLTAQDGVPSLRFAELIEDMVNAVNDLTTKPINTITDDFTLILTDVVIRYTGSTNITITIPADTFEVGDEIEIQNDGTAIITVDTTTDTLTSSAGLGIGERSIAAKGDARIFLTASTNWKISGNQIT